MKNEILKVTDSVNGANLCKIIRPLQESDFAITEHKHKLDTDMPTALYCSYRLTLNQEVVDHLVDSLGIDTVEASKTDYPSGRRFRRIRGFEPFCESWNVSGAWIVAMLTKTFSFSGIKLSDTEVRMKKYKANMLALIDEWDDTKGEILQEKLIELQKSLAEKVEECNERFSDSVGDMFLHLNIKDEFFEQHDSDEREDQLSLLAEVEGGIKVLKSKRIDVKKALSEIEREMLITYLLENSDLSRAGKLIAIKARQKAEGVMPNSRRAMFE